MPLLDTAIAFALTMLGIATTVTVILGALRRMAAVRSKVMGRMLNTYLHAELKPLAEAALTRTLGAAEGARRNLRIVGQHGDRHERPRGAVIVAGREEHLAG
jgi:hypothetical protein